MAKLTKNHCIEQAKRFKTRSQWASQSPTTYAKAKKISHRFFNLCTAHMIVPINLPWTREEILKEIEIINGQPFREWKIQSPNSYQAALKKGKFFFNKCKKMFKPTPIKWTRNNILAEARRFNTLREWREKSPSSLSKSFRHGTMFYRKCSAHMTKVKSRTKWTKKTLYEEAQKHTTVSSWRKSSAFGSSRKFSRSFRNKCTKHMINKAKKIWTKKPS